MAFSKKIKDEVAISSGRYCCICKKFCGINMEFHHIIAKSDGGGDTLDNCLPVCFNCHANIGHYNVQHPKGNKYSALELKGHRDKLYSLIKQGKLPDSTVSIDDNYKKIDIDRDIKLFNEINKMISYENFIHQMEMRDMYTGYLTENEIDLMQTIDDFSKNPNHMFLDNQIQDEWLSFVSAMSEFDWYTAEVFFSDLKGENEYIFHIPKEHKINFYDRSIKEAKSTNDLKNKMVIAYRKFIETAHKHLHI